MLAYIVMYGYIWQCIGLYGDVWVCNGMNGYVWVCIGKFWYVWKQGEYITHLTTFRALEIGFCGNKAPISEFSQSD